MFLTVRIKEIDNKVYNQIQIITIKGSVGYIVTHTAPKEFEKYIDDVNKMIETLRILPLPYCYATKGVEMICE